MIFRGSSIGVGKAASEVTPLIRTCTAPTLIETGRDNLKLCTAFTSTKQKQNALTAKTK